MKEVAEHFGVKEGLVASVCTGIARQKPRHYWGGAPLKGRIQDAQNVERFIAEKVPGFTFAGNYTGHDGTVDLWCDTCGSIMTRSWVTVRHSSVLCRVCDQRRRDEKEKAKREDAERREREAKEKEKARAWAKYENSIKQWSFAVCKECGEIFVPDGKTKCYCSERCRRKAVNNRKDRRIAGKRQNSGITLEKVYGRDGGTCYLCGESCDWDDYEERNGNKIAGDWYPSIDHVIPLAHGGTHTWDNVRLAHRRCNYLKSDAPR